MHKVLRPVKDAYITNRVIDDERRNTANVGGAGSLDLYKLYGFTSTGTGSAAVPNTELTRLLVKFDLDPLRAAVTAGKVDVNDASFRCSLKLHDVYAGQPTPSGFTVNVYPLSASFDEGLGRDVVFYADSDACNWLTGSIAGGAWFVTGCGRAGDDTGPCDFLTGTLGWSTHLSQSFVTGEEDLAVDVTRVVSGVIAGSIPDSGFRISLATTHEVDDRSYFVKRFASRTAFNEALRPKLTFGFDDSVQDDTNDMHLDTRGYLFLRSYERSAPANLASGSSEVTGPNSLLLTLTTPVSGGLLSLYFTGSQHRRGIHRQVGIYSASVLVSSSIPALVSQWQTSGSVTFTPTWGSLDGTVAYHTGSALVVWPPQRSETSLAPRRLNVTLTGIRPRIGPTEAPTVRIDIFDVTSPHLTRASRVPVVRPSAVFRDVHWQLRDAMTGDIAVAFDTVGNSTRASNDASGMYFRLDASNLTPGRSYVVDILVTTGGDEQVYQSASTPFKVAPTA